MAITNLRIVARSVSRSLPPCSTWDKPLEQGMRRIVRQVNKFDQRYRTAVKDAFRQNHGIPTGPRLSKGPKCHASPISRDLDLHMHEELAAKYAMALHSCNRFLGPQNYPHEFKNYGGLPLRHNGPYYEFPLLSSGKLYQGDAPGLRRIVFTAEGIIANVIEHCKFELHGFKLIA